MTTADQFKKIKEDKEKYQKELARVNSRNMYRYHNEEGYREKILAKQKEIRLKKKQQMPN